MHSLAKPTSDNTVGAILLGMAGASFFVGLSTLQVYLYFHRFPRDTLLIKSAVAILWALDTFHLMLVIHAVYFYAVPNWGNFLNLNRVVWSVKLQMPIDVIIVVMVQSLYAIRVIRLGSYHRSLLGYLTAAVVTWGFGIGMILSYKVYSATYYTDIREFSWALNATFATSTIIDTVIAAGMVCYLRKSKDKHHRLNTKISRAIQYTLSSGALTSACSLTCMFTWILVPNTFNFIAFGFFLTKLYAGSFFAMLNARDHTPQAPSKELGLRVHLPIPRTSPSPMPPQKNHSAQDSASHMKTYATPSSPDSV